MELVPHFTARLLAAVQPGKLFQIKPNGGALWGIRGVDNENAEGAKVILLRSKEGGGAAYGRINPAQRCLVLQSNYQLTFNDPAAAVYSKSFSKGSIYLFGETVAIGADPMDNFYSDEEWFDVATGRTYRPDATTPVCRFDSWSIRIKGNNTQSDLELFSFQASG